MSHANDNDNATDGQAVSAQAIPSRIAKPIIGILLFLIAAIILNERREKSEAEKAALRAEVAARATINYVEAYPGMDLAKDRNNLIGLPPGAETGCITAPYGYYFSEKHGHEFDDVLEIRGGCSNGNPGYLSTRHSQHRPRSFSAKNHGREPASINVWVRPD